MSVIGTTLKQPRVFAHDAVSLKDLPGCFYAGAKGFDLITGSGNSGEGFEVGKCYQTINETGNGSGAVVVVVATDASGGITEIDTCEGFCNFGTMYSEGDILTVVWEPSTTYPTSGVNSTGKVQVDGLVFTEWDYGCPFSPMENRLYTEEELDVLGNVFPSDGKPLSSFKQKDIVKWNCGEGEGPIECEWETFNPGAALYVGIDLATITVIMESGSKATFENVSAGTFLPILCLTICGATGKGEEPPTAEIIKGSVIVLF